MEKTRDYSLNSVRNALRILRSFTMDEPEKKVTELSESLGLSKSTVSRLLATMAEEGFVVKDPVTRQYRLGWSVLALSGILTTSMDIYRESTPVLRKLVEKIDETAHIAVLEETDIVYLHKIECSHPVRILTHIGKRNPSYCTSAGKLLLAYNQQPNLLDKVIASGLPKQTANTITNPNRFRQTIEQVCTQGYAVSVEEFREGIVSVAAPIRNYTGQVIAAVNIVAPIQRVNHTNIHLFIKKVIEAGLEISEKMGYRQQPV